MLNNISYKTIYKTNKLVTGIDCIDCIVLLQENSNPIRNYTFQTYDMLGTHASDHTRHSIGES